MKKTLFSLLAILALFFALNACQNSTPSVAPLKVEGVKMADNAGNVVVLRGMSFGWHNWWPQYWNADVVKWLKDDWNCNVVRAAMGVEHEDGYVAKPEYSEGLLTEVVDAAIENGIYVIIDWHAHKIHTKEAIEFFGKMAQKYGEYPNVIYEIFNEPVKQSWEEVKEYSERVIDEIRKYDPDNIILVGSPHWDQDIHIVADNPLTEYSNLMYTVHFYAATHKEWLRERSDYALSKGIPIFVSEYGICKANGNGDMDIEEWNLWLDWMDKNHISWCKWSIADKDETCSVLKPGTTNKGNWKMEDLKPSGIETRKVLLKP